MNYRVLLLISLSLLLITSTGCGKIPKLKNGQELAISMNDISITTDEFYQELKERYGKEILIDIIDREILNREYKNNEELKEEIDAQIEYVKLQTGDEFLEVIKNQGGFNNENELAAYIEINLKRKMAINDYVRTLIKDKEITNYYEQEIVGDIRASHILIKPKVTDDMPSEEKKDKEEEALTLANDLIKQLNEGAKFKDLAKKYSDDEGTATKGGDLEWFNKNKMTKAFEEAAFNLDLNTYTKVPIKTEFGYHIILKTDEAEKEKLKAVKESIIINLIEKKIEDNPNLNNTALEQLRKKYKLKIHDSVLNKQYKDYLKILKGLK